MVTQNDTEDCSDKTVDTTGVRLEELKDKAYKMTEAAIIHKFYLNLAQKEVGTHGVETKAFKLFKERRSKEGMTVDPNEDITTGRDPEMVVDLLKVKMKYAQGRENETKVEYEKEKARMEKEIEKGTRKWRKLRGKLQHYINDTWDKLKVKYDEKADKLKEKYDSKKMKKKTKEEEEEDELIAGILITDKELDKMIEEGGKIEIAQYGDLERELDEDEKSLLRLQPKFAVYDKIDMKRIREELEVAKTKMRWERRRNGYCEDEDKRTDEEGEKEDEENERIEIRMREIYDPENETVDLRKRMATDVKTNQRVFLPQPRPAREEAELMVRTERLERIVSKYMEENCNEKGEIIETNITNQQKRGLKKLLKRVKEGEIVVTTTDKSGKLCVCSWDNYINQGRKHINGDREVKWKEIKDIQKRVTSHARVLVKVFNIGEEWGEMNQKRINGAYSTEAGIVPVLSTMVKDHKPLEGKDPKTRPVCSASTSVNGRLSEITSDFLMPIAMAQESDECLSSEEMIYYIGEAAVNIEKDGRMVIVASQDVDGLYPNLDIADSAVICGEAVRDTKLKIEGVDYVWAGKYIALTCSPQEIDRCGLTDIVPIRRHKKGTRPGITGEKEEEKETKWRFKRMDFTEGEKRMLLAKVIEISIKTTFKNHLYQFEGRSYIQAKGGSIGLRLTGVVAKLVMNRWNVRFKELAIQNEITIYLNKTYVDDQNLLLEALDMGRRWTGDKIEWRAEWEKEDNESVEKDDKRTMRQVRLMANSILPYIQMKEEVASDCPEEKLPMLDFKVWKEEETEERGEKKTVIKYEFYEKAMASKLVMMNKSALPHRMKVTTLSQEVIRRLKNTARSVGESRRQLILSNMMAKMRRAGYDEKMRRNVLVSGLKGYWRMVKTENEGGRRVNRPRWEGAVERRYKKLGAKASWYKRKSKKIGEKNKRKGGKFQGRGKEEKTDIETIMFVPHTPDSALAKMLQEEDDNFRRGTKIKRIKMVERGGTTIKDMLSCSNPWAKEGCDREDCFPCLNEKGKGGNCQQESVCYTITCLECEMGGIKAEYQGETSRTAYLRGSEHLQGLENEDEKNALWKHCCQEHQGRHVKFKMKVLRSHKTPLTRQIQESVEIECSLAKIIMNSKGEWNGSRIPRIKIEVGEKLQEEDDDKYTKKSDKKNEHVETREWTTERLTKRKMREGETSPQPKRMRKSEPSGYECGPAQPEAMSRSEPECGQTEPVEKQNEKFQGKKIECGTTQPCTREKFNKQRAGPGCGKTKERKQNDALRPEKPSQRRDMGMLEKWLRKNEKLSIVVGCGNEQNRSESGPAWPENAGEDEYLNSVMEKVEICISLVDELLVDVTTECGSNKTECAVNVVEKADHYKCNGEAEYGNAGHIAPAKNQCGNSEKSKPGKPECGPAEPSENDEKAVQKVREAECGVVHCQKCLVCGANLSTTSELVNICKTLIEKYFPKRYEDRTKCGPADLKDEVPECGMRYGEAPECVRRKRKRSVGEKETKEKQGQEKGKDKEVEFEKERKGITNWLRSDKTSVNGQISDRRSTKPVTKNKIKLKNFKKEKKCKKLGENVQKITKFFENLQTQSSGVKWVEKNKVNSKLSKQVKYRRGLVAVSTGVGVGGEVQTGLEQEVGEQTKWGGEGDTRAEERGGGTD